jgi:biotin carboxyl carrier protein
VKRYRVTIDGRIYDVDIDDPTARPVTARISGVAFSVDVEPDRGDQQEPDEKTPPEPVVTRTAESDTPPRAETAVDGPRAMTAPIPGVVASVAVTAGQTVHRGDELVTLDAMKMLNVIRSPWEGTVATVHVAQGGRVVQGEPLVTFVPT